MWDTAEMKGLEERRGARRARLDQCMLGCCSRKPPCLSGTLRGLELLDELRRDGSHQRASSEGRLPDGTFRASPPHTYPAPVCARLGEMITGALRFFPKEGLGGTGWKRPVEAGRAIAAWSERSTTRPAVAFRNEDVLHGKGLWLDKGLQAFYLRADDGLVMA